MKDTHPLDGEILRLMKAINQIDGAYYFCAKRLAIQENTLALLYALSDGQPHTQKQVGEDWLIPKTTVNTIVRELRQEGYLTLVPLPHSREKALVLTPEGQEYSRRRIDRIKTAEREALARTLAEHPQLVDQFEQLAQQLCQSLQNHVLPERDPAP